MYLLYIYIYNFIEVWITFDLEVSSQYGWAHAHLGAHAPKEIAWGLRVLDEGVTWVTSSLYLVWHAEVIATFLAGRWGLGHQFWVRSFKCWSWHLCNFVHFSNSPSFVSVIHPSSSSCWGWTIFWVPAVHVWQLSVAWLIDTCPLAHLMLMFEVTAANQFWNALRNCAVTIEVTFEPCGKECLTSGCLTRVCRAFFWCWRCCEVGAPQDKT